MPSVPIDTTTAADLVAAPASGFIRVHAYDLSLAGAAEARLKDGDNAVLTGLASAAEGNAVAKAFAEQGYFDLPPLKKLHVTVSAAVRLLGHVTYTIRGKDLGV